MSWLTFWNGTHSIYAGPRHKALHYEIIARDIAALIPSGAGTVLDYGCGEATSAALVANQCQQLLLYDAAPRVRALLADLYQTTPRIRVLDEQALAAIPDRSLSVIVANSLAQYLTKNELAALLDSWSQKLKPYGLLLLGDIIPPDANAFGDAAGLLKFGWAEGFFVTAVCSLAKTLFSDYRQLRQSLGLSRYSATDMIALMQAHGLIAERAPSNIGHNQCRMLFKATLKPASLPV